MLAIYKREMRSYFTTSTGYIFLACALLISGFVFSLTTILSETSDTSTYFLVMLFLMMVFLPILTMKTFSEERRTKTEQLLLTAPVSIISIIMGKFFSALTMLLAYMGLSMFNLIPLFTYVAEDSNGPNIAMLFGNMIALILVGMCFIAIGIFVSSLTENQFAAIVITIGILLSLLLVNIFNGYIGSYAVRMVLDWISIYSRFQSFTYGIFDIGATIYYLSITGIFLFLTTRVFEARRYN